MSVMAVSVEGLTVAYGDRVVLRGLTFTVGEGEVAVVVGPNGSGKTTLIRAILGLVRPVEGRVAMFGRDVTGSPRDAGRFAGYVPQHVAVPSFPLTVLEYVVGFALMRARPPRAPTRRLIARAMEVLDMVGIGDLADAALSSLSGGQLRRAAIARALLAGPRVLLMDEPLANLDEEGKRSVVRVVEALRGDTSIVVSTHGNGLPSGLIDMVVRLGGGRGQVQRW